MKKKINVSQKKLLVEIEKKERNMIEEANELGCHNIKYYLPNKEAQDRGDVNVGMRI